MLEYGSVITFDIVMVEKLQPKETEVEERSVVVIVDDEPWAVRWKEAFESKNFEVIAVVPKDVSDLGQKLFVEIDEETRERIALVFCHRYWNSTYYPDIIQAFINSLRETSEEILIIETGAAINLTKYYRGVNGFMESYELDECLESFSVGDPDPLTYLRRRIFFDESWSFAMEIAVKTDGWGEIRKIF